MPKPKDWDEFAKLYREGTIEIIREVELDDGTTKLIVFDKRKDMVVGELYEIII